MSEELRERIRSALPPKSTKRDQRIAVYWTEEEFRRVEDFAAARDQSLTAAVRALALAALDALGE